MSSNRPDCVPGSSSFSDPVARLPRRVPRRVVAGLTSVGACVGVLVLMSAGAPAALAAATPIDLGTATSYAVIGGTTVTNTGVSNISGDLGVSPGTAVVGFPPGIVTNGAIHSADANAGQAQADLTTAYNTAAGETPQTAVGPELGGKTLVPGVYGNSDAAGTLGLTGTLTLNGQNKPNALFVFQADSTLITASSSRVVMINGANPCNVFWQVGSSATLGTDTRFRGNILALTSITLDTDANIIGRALARNGAVTLDSNDINASRCTAAGPTATASPTASSSPTATSSPTGGSPSASPTGGSGSTIPAGHPATGEGGAAGSDHTPLLLGGGLALTGAFLASLRASRRAHVPRHSHR